MKKTKKQIKGLLSTSLIAGAGAVGLGAIGGAAATHGATGIANTMRFAPAMGTMVGTGMMLRTVQNIEPKKKRKKR